MSDEKFLDAGTFDWSLGQDAWHSPDAIRDNQFAAGVNLTTRGGVLSPRPRFIERELIFPNQTLTVKPGITRQLDDIFHSGKFQAQVPYVVGTEEYLLVVVSGLIFQVQVDTYRVKLLSSTIIMDQYRPRINWSYAAGQVVFFDWPANPVIVNGNDVSRASPDHLVNGLSAPQVPVSWIGTYNQNRLFVGSFGVNFTAGDPTGSLLTPEAPITFTEVFLDNSPFVNQFFSLPVEEAIYPITAMGFIQQQDENTGIGPLFIGTEKKVYYYQTDQPRAQWTQGVFGKVLIANAGIAGARAFVNVNSDVLFMSPEGDVYAVTTARNDAKRWGNVPISREVSNYLKFWDPSLSQFAVLGYFNNYVLISANPYRVQCTDRQRNPTTDYAHAGFVVLELEALASLLSDGSPVWDGLWTGVNPMEISNIGKRCFVMSKDGIQPYGTNKLYELSTKQGPDIVRGNPRQVRSIVYTKMYQTEQAYAVKREGTINVALFDVEGKFSMKIERRPAQSLTWLDAVDWSHEAPMKTCEMPDDMFINGFTSHQFPQLVFGDPKQNGCNPVSEEPYDTFLKAQYRITLQGDDWILNDYKVRFFPLSFAERQDPALCNPYPVVAIPAQCEPDWLIPEENLCRS